MNLSVNHRHSYFAQDAVLVLQKNHNCYSKHTYKHMSHKDPHISKAHISHTQHSVLYFLSTAECPDLPDHANGMVVMAGNSVGDTATYICDPGFELVGVQTPNSQADGTWSDNPPTCKPIGMKSPLYCRMITYGCHKHKLP